MQKYMRFLLLFSAVLLIIIPACKAQKSQQDDPATTQADPPPQDEHPLIKILALIPDMPAVRETGVSYVDYWAIVEARLGDQTPRSREDLSADEGAVEGLWLAALRGIISGPSRLLQHGIMDDTNAMVTLVGFGLFDVIRGAEFLSPPVNVTLFQGNFDSEAVAAALSGREYTQHTLDGGMTLWCGPNGCESGAEVNLVARNPINPFGGELGRDQPVLVFEDYVISSTDNTLLERYPKMAAGTVSTLADAPDYRAIADALVAQDGALIQAQFYGPEVFGSGQPQVLETLLDPNLTGEAREAAINEIKAQIAATQDQVLPVYTAMVIADYVTGNSQRAVVGIVFMDGELAQIAADVLYERIGEYQSMQARRPFTELLEQREATLGDPQFYTHDDTGLTVLLIPFTAPLPPQTIMETPPGGYMQSSMTFRLFATAVIARDMGWMAVGPG